MMDYQQTVTGLIEGRVSPDAFAAMLDADPGLMDWLQSCIPEGTTWEQYVPATLDELLRAELPDALYVPLAAAMTTLRSAPEAQALDALAALLPLLGEAAHIIPSGTVLAFHLTGTYTAMLDGTIPCTDAQRRALPAMMLEAIDRPCERRVTVPYSVRDSWDSLRGDARPGTLAFRVNLHGWITQLIGEYRPDIAITPDDTLDQQHSLLLDACPECVDGPEIWDCGILEGLIAELPAGLKRAAQVKQLKARIREVFHLDQPGAKKPRWRQSPDWPVHEGRPMRFLRTEKRYGGAMLLHHFVDDATGTERIVQDGD